MKHRSETERIALILEAIKCNSNRGGESQTRIMYKAYLSHSQLKEYLSVLLEKGLIEYQKEDRLYTITQRGIHFIQIYNQQLQISNNMFTSTNKYQSAGSTSTTGFKSGESSYVTFSEVATANHRWKCEKCEKPLVSMKELKLHKFEYHSY